jgi:tripartite-type tricarboxylate transporter receptor subunit TctC
MRLTGRSSGARVFGPPEISAPVVEYWLNPLAQTVQSPAWKAGLGKKQ